jgi:hypothetical protein
MGVGDARRACWAQDPRRPFLGERMTRGRSSKEPGGEPSISRRFEARILGELGSQRPDCVAGAGGVEVRRETGKE